MSVDPATAPEVPAWVKDSTGNYYRIGGGNPTTGLDQATADGLYVNATGDTMTGNLTLTQHGVVFTTADAGISQSAAGGLYISDALSTTLKPLGVGAPTTPEHAAPKSYVDQIVTTSTVDPVIGTDIPTRDGLLWIVVP